MKKNPHWMCKKCGCFLGTDLTWIMSNVFKGEPRSTINVGPFPSCEETVILF